MAIIAPKERKHLSADALFGLIRSGFAIIPDDRLSDTDITSPDALMSAFAMFSLYHQMLGAAILHPDVRAVIPLMPEPIVKQDGVDKNDCERNAAKRFVAKLRHDHPHLRFIMTEDSLSANAPPSRRCIPTICTLSSGAKKAIMPCCSLRCRRQSEPVT